MAKLKNKNIVIVEDNVSLVDIFKGILENEGATVFTAYNGEEGLELCAKFKPHLTITDISMPHMDGFEMIEKLKSVDHTKSLPIIVLTAVAMKDQVVKAITLGADAYLVKPAKTEDLLEKVYSLLEPSLS